MGKISFWHFQTIWLRIFFLNLIPKKRKILGVAQNGSISDDWIFRVANFLLNYCRHFFNNIANTYAHLVANFLNFSKHPQHYNLIVLKGVMDKNKKSDIRKYANLKPTLKFNLFWGWVFSTFFLTIWFKSTKMKFRPYFALELVEKLTKKK